MTVREIGHRTYRTFSIQLQRFGFGSAKYMPEPNADAFFKPFLYPNAVEDNSSYLQAADEIIEGRFPILSLKEPTLAWPPEWNRDPLTGTPAPAVFGKTIDYRDPAKVGDIKYLWELNRHLQFPILAQAYYLSGEKYYLEAIQTLLRSWLDQCPYPLGPNWISSLELGIRLINWSLTWQLLKLKRPESSLFEESQNLERRWLDSVYQHAHFIQGHYSRHSSANNHLIGEAAGLYIASLTWPFWKDLESWGKTAYEILVEEALKQNAPDGVNREQAISYQQFVLDFMLLSALMGRANGMEFPKEYWARIEAMLEFIAAIMDVEGHVPMIGDSDDAFVVYLSQEADFCPYRSLLATGAVLFSRADFKATAGKLDDKTRWLVGDRAESFELMHKKVTEKPLKRFFRDGGYYILGSGFDTPDEIKLIVDAGPLGYQAIAAHGHADALAFSLFIKGREFLIDPGTYAYHTEQKWRNYFRGTAAHNTVRVDGEDQSVMGGNFMWVRHANAKCDSWVTTQDKGVFIGSHDGYKRLPDPVVHSREIHFDKSRRIIEIVDSFDCLAAHVVERFWHFSEACLVSAKDQSIVVENKGVNITLAPQEKNIEMLEYTGNEDPPAGWISRRLDEKVPTRTVVWRSRVTGNSHLETVIDCSQSFV